MGIPWNPVCSHGPEERLADDDDEVMLNILRCQLTYYLLGTSCDWCRSTVQYSFMSMKTRRLVRMDSPGRPPRLSHSSWTKERLAKELKLLYPVGITWNPVCIRGPEERPVKGLKLEKSVVVFSTHLPSKSGHWYCGSLVSDEVWHVNIICYAHCNTL